MKNEEVKFSVVIPYYNMGKYIDESLGSVLSQTLESVEIIIVNDGTDDKHSVAKLKELKKKYNNVIFVDQQNKGLSGARNSGIREAAGKYICCLDSDDRIEPEYLQKAYDFYQSDEKGEYAIVTANVKTFGQREENWNVLEYSEPALFIENVLQSASTFRKSVWEKVGRFDEKMRGGYEDWDFWLRIIIDGYKWKVLDGFLINYRIREDSMVQDSDKKRKELYSYIIDKNIDSYKNRVSELLIYSKEKYFKLLENHYNLERIRSEQVDDYEARQLKLTNELAELQSELFDMRSSRVWKIRKAIRNPKWAFSKIKKKIWKK